MSIFMRCDVFLLWSVLLLGSCSGRQVPAVTASAGGDDTTAVKPTLPAFTRDQIVIEKALLYDEHILADTYPYRDTVREFQWGKIRDRLFFLDSLQMQPADWAILQNYKNRNGEAPVARDYVRNAYKRVSDRFGVERYQSVPLFAPGDSLVPERYGRDGSLVKLLGRGGEEDEVATVSFPGRWIVPSRYVKPIGDTVRFTHAVFVDRVNQNIATLEKVNGKWLVRSMNPATTGLHNPPYGQETPTGMFVIQERKPKMIYLKDGSAETGGFAPWASRFTNGGYLHGVPVNAPGKAMIEFSGTLGTTPRSHMCVRNATSHAKFIYDWAPVLESVVFVFD